MLKEVKIELTEMCHRNCIHCSSNAIMKNYQSMNPEVVKKIIDQASSLGATSIVFTGGEATLYPSLEELILYATEKNMKTKLYTMADPSEETIRKIEKLTFYGLGEMIYSTTYRLTRDQIVTLDKLSTFFPTLLEEVPISLGFHHVVTKDTLEDIEDSLQLFFSLPADKTTHFSLLRYIPHGRGDKSLLLSEEETKKLKNKMIIWKRQYQEKIRLGSPWNYLGISHTSCTAADKTMIVGFDGSVYPCDAMKYFDYLGSGGNIYESSLEEIYHSSYFKRIREEKSEASESCKKCPDFSLCHGGCLGQKMVAYVDSNHLSFESYGNQAIRTMRQFESLNLQRMNGELGLIGELGEFIDSFKKYKTHGLEEESKEKLRKNIMVETGDVLWYLAASLGNSYGISFEEVGEYLIAKRFSNKIRLEDNDIKRCALKEDPECLRKMRKTNYSLSEIDTLISSSYDFEEEWKRLISIACQMLYVSNKEKMIEQISAFLISLATIVNYELGSSIEEAAKLNVEKLKNRYERGFSSEVANSRVELLTAYKKQEVEDKPYQKHI